VGTHEELLDDDEEEELESEDELEDDDELLLDEEDDDDLLLEEEDEHCIMHIADWTSSCMKGSVGSSDVTVILVTRSFFSPMNLNRGRSSHASLRGLPSVSRCVAKSSRCIWCRALALPLAAKLPVDSRFQDDFCSKP
jgi:hypothetical protein